MIGDWSTTKKHNLVVLFLFNIEPLRVTSQSLQLLVDPQYLRYLTWWRGTLYSTGCMFFSGECFHIHIVSRIMKLWDYMVVKKYKLYCKDVYYTFNVSILSVYWALKITFHLIPTTHWGYLKQQYMYPSEDPVLEPPVTPCEIRWHCTGGKQDHMAPLSGTSLDTVWSNDLN